MWEILGFGFVSSLLGGIYKRIKPDADFLEISFGSAAGEAIEELFESIINLPKKAFLACIWNKALRSKLKKELRIQIEAFHSSLSTAEVNELKDFLNCYGPQAKSGLSSYESDEEGKRLKKREVKKTAKGIESSLIKRIDLPSSHDILREMYGARAAENAPPAMLRLIEILRSFALNNMYVVMSKENRQFAVAVASMVERALSRAESESDGKTVAELGEINKKLNLLLQQHVSGDVQRVNGGAVLKDPWVYTLLTCPGCGATGQYVKRAEGDILCKCCGGTYKRYEGLPKDEIKAELDNIKEELQRSAALEKENAEQIINGIRQVVIERSFFEAQFDRLNGAAEKSVAGVCAGITKEIRAVLDNESGNIQKKLELYSTEQSIRLRAMERQVSDLFSNKLSTLLDNMSDGFENMKKMLGEEINRLHDEHKNLSENQSVMRGGIDRIEKEVNRQVNISKAQTDIIREGFKHLYPGKPRMDTVKYICPVCHKEASHSATADGGLQCSRCRHIFSVAESGRSPEYYECSLTYDGQSQIFTCDRVEPENRKPVLISIDQTAWLRLADCANGEVICRLTLPPSAREKNLTVQIENNGIKSRANCKCLKALVELLTGYSYELRMIIIDMVECRQLKSSATASLGNIKGGEWVARHEDGDRIIIEKQRSRREKLR